MNTVTSRIVADFGPHRGRMDRDFGHPGLFVLGIILLAGLVVLAVLLISSSRRGPRHDGNMPPMAPAAPLSASASAETILSERFARGEVSVEDFVAARSALRGEWTPTAGPAPTTQPITAEPPSRSEQ